MRKTAMWTVAVAVTLGSVGVEVGGRVYSLSVGQSCAVADEGPRREGPRDGEGRRAVEDERAPAARLSASERKAQRIFRAYDKDGNDEVTFDEWCKMKEGAMDAAREARERKWFDTADGNGNGTLTVQEFHNWMNRKPAREGGASAEGEGDPSPKRNPSDRKARGVFRAYDKDGNSEVSFGEWCKMKEGAMDAARETRERRWFDSADADGNGVLSYEEFYNYRTRKTTREGPRKGPPDNPSRRSPEEG